MLKKALFLLFVFILIPGISRAEIKTYIHTVKQSFGGSQSPDDARVGAIAKAKREVLEKAGTYLESLTIVRENVVEKDEILALAAGVLKAEIVSQKNYHTEDAFGIIVEAKVDVDTSILEDRIKKLLQDRSLIEKYQKSQKREKELLARIERLERKNRKLQQSTSPVHNQEKKDLKKEFRKATQGLTAIEWNDKALSLWENGKYTNPDRALEYLKRAVHLDPTFADAYNNRGVAWREKGQYDRAIRDHNKAIELNPQDALAYSNRGAAWRDKGQYDRAIRDYNKAIELNTQHADVYYNRGNAWREKGQYDRAIRDYNKVIELNPQDAMAYSNRGLSWCGKGQHVRAIRDYNRAIKLNPQYGEAFYNRGLAYGILGQYRKAVDDLNYYLKLCGHEAKDADRVRRLIEKLGYTPAY